MKLTVIICFLIFLFALHGCVLDPSAPYSFRQEEAMVERVSILKQNDQYSDWQDRFSVITELDESQFSAFLTEITKVKGQPFINPPHDSFDEYVIEIIYQDGEIEYISSNNNAYWRPGQELQIRSYWFSDKDGFDKLVARYAWEPLG